MESHILAFLQDQAGGMCDERNQLCQCCGFMLLSQKLHLHCQFESFNFSIQKPVLPGCSHCMHAESLLESLLEWTSRVCVQISISKVSLQAGPRMAPARSVLMLFGIQQLLSASRHQIKNLTGIKEAI